MVKAYLKYQHASCFGLIFSPNSQVIYDWSGKFCIAGALEYVIIWNIRQGLPTCVLVDQNTNAQVTCVAISPDQKNIAVGYSDGKVRIWEWKVGSRRVQAPTVLSGHLSAISALQFNQKENPRYSKGQLLCSGSRDGKLVIWDTIEQKGLFRLQGHKDQITQCRFLENSPGLLSSSKDTLVKLWDLETQHCTQTLVGHRKEVWSFTVNPEETRLYTSAADSQIRVFSFTYSEDPAESAKLPVLEQIGSLPRESKDRSAVLKLSPSGKMLMCQAAGKMIEFFSIFDAQDIARRKKRRIKRVKKKLEKQAKPEQNEQMNDDDDDDIPEFVVTDEIAPSHVLKTPTKITFCDFSPKRPQVVVGLSNNSLEFYDLEENASTQVSDISLPGHRSDIRYVALSGDNSLMFSTSQDLTKIWNVFTTQCIKTIESGYGLCGSFVPGNRHIIIGTKEGTLELYDVSSGDLVEEIEAHNGEIWSLVISPDQRTVITGSADKQLKFWEFQLKQNPNSAKRTLGLSHTKTVVMEDDILNVCLSKDMKFLAVSLLDTTVKVFHADTMNFFLSLYGHKLPVLSVDISSDSTLLVTASADKNVKLWGLDFGDCHRSLFAHDDNVMQVKFITDTHYFFTIGKDKLVKYWDGDTYEQISVLRGHAAEVWGLTVSNDGEFIVTSSHDRSIRVWERSKDQIFVDEERENELEKMFESSLEQNQPSLEEGQRESALATTRNLVTIKAGERLLEALEAAEVERIKHQEHQAYLEAQHAISKTLGKRTREESELIQPSPLLQGKTPSEYILSALSSIPSNDLEQALMVMSFPEVILLFSYFQDWMTKGLEVELCCRAMFFLLKLHHHQIVSNRALLHQLTSLQSLTKNQLRKKKNTAGLNKAAMNFIARQIEQTQSESIFFEITEKIMKERKQKR